MPLRRRQDAHRRIVHRLARRVSDRSPESPACPGPAIDPDDPARLAIAHSLRDQPNEPILFLRQRTTRTRRSGPSHRNLRLPSGVATFARFRLVTLGPNQTVRFKPPRNPKSPFGGLSEGVGARGGPEKLIKMPTCQRRRRLRLEAAVPAARGSIALLSRRPSLSPLSKSPRRCSLGFTGVLAVRNKRSPRYRMVPVAASLVRLKDGPPHSSTCRCMAGARPCLGGCATGWPPLPQGVAPDPRGRHCPGRAGTAGTGRSSTPNTPAAGSPTD